MLLKIILKWLRAHFYVYMLGECIFQKGKAGTFKMMKHCVQEFKLVLKLLH